MPLIAVPGSSMKKEMLHYLNNKEFSDVVIQVEDKEIYAHRVVLSRCQKFNSILQNDPQLKELKITDTDYAVFTALLEYLYSDDINIPAAATDPVSFALQLKNVSEVYGIPSLHENLEFKLAVGLEQVPLQQQLPKTFANNMKPFINNQYLSDISFQVEGSIIHAHKVSYSLQ